MHICAPVGNVAKGELRPTGGVAGEGVDLEPHDARLGVIIR